MLQLPNKTACDMLCKSLTLAARRLMLATLLVYLSSKLAMMLSDLHPHATAIILLHSCTYISSLPATHRFQDVLIHTAQTHE